MGPDSWMGLANVGWKQWCGYELGAIGGDMWDSGSKQGSPGTKRWSRTTKNPWCLGPMWVPHGWLLAGMLLLLPTRMGFSPCSSLETSWDLGPDRQMASFLPLFCLCVFCFPASHDGGGNHALHCIFNKARWSRGGKRMSGKEPFIFLFLVQQSSPDKCGSFPCAWTPIDFPSVRIPQALPTS